MADTEPNTPPTFEYDEKYRVTLPDTPPDQQSQPLLQKKDTDRQRLLNDGDIIIYVGQTAPVGQEKIRYDKFAHAETGFIGVFHPEEWGTADTTYLEFVGTVTSSHG